ncbi:MAG TPA: lysophospholipid acyltransferase family protein [Polyangiaceae bacterium]|nr:lysophospholipid acyltransferase family protein [Polyangiaceae bacterium]
MDPRKNALVRASDLAAQGGAFFSRLLQGAKRVADEVSERVLGADFDRRVALLSERYESAQDPFGFDPEIARKAAATCAFFHRLYFRTEVFGIENVPQGRALLIANHSGQIPIDAAIIGSAMFLDAEPPRVTRSMVDKWTATLPFVSMFFSRVGQVVGLPENARRLLAMEELLLAFPEGTRGVAKPFSKRYELEAFGRGFMRLALETNTPIVPVAVIGAEEQYISFGNLTWAAKALRLPVFPLVPQVLLPGGQLPLPTKYRIYFGEPMRFYGDPDDDEQVIADKVWLVRQTIAHMLTQGLKARRGVFF